MLIATAPEANGRLMIPDAQGRVWHSETITSSTEKSLHDLSAESIVSSFYLAGGTGLALQFGHRISEDLDFFSRELSMRKLSSSESSKCPDVLLSRKRHPPRM